MNAPSSCGGRDASLSLSASGAWEVELFELTYLGREYRFRDFFEHLEVAVAIVCDWLGPIALDPPTLGGCSVCGGSGVRCCEFGADR